MRMTNRVRESFLMEAEEQQAYVLLDGAQNENLLDLLTGPEGPAYKCLFPGELEPDMVEVAPYLVRLEMGSSFASWVFENAWGENWGIFVLSRESLSKVWRHLRGQVSVYGPELEPLYFRYYDPRVFRNFMTHCDEGRLQDFFGCVNSFFVEGDGSGKIDAYVWSMNDGKLVGRIVEAGSES